MIELTKDETILLESYIAANKQTNRAVGNYLTLDQANILFILAVEKARGDIKPTSHDKCHDGNSKTRQNE